MTDIFISYARENRSFAYGELYKAFCDDKTYQAWIDKEGIDFAVPWWQEICDAIDAADNFIFVVSGDSLSSIACNREVDRAISGRKRIIPIIYCSPDSEALSAVWSTADWTPWKAVAESNWKHIRSLNWLFFNHDADGIPIVFADAFAALLETIREDHEHKKFHTRMTVWAREWEKKQHSPSLLLRGDDLKSAEAWQQDSVGKIPALSPLHELFIEESRKVEDALAAEEARKTRLALRLKRLALTLAGLVAAGVVAVIVAALLLREAEFRFKLADALRLHTLGSNYYMAFFDPEAKAAYEQSFDTLNPDEREPWTVFMQAEYQNAGIHIARWFHNLGMAEAQLADDDDASASQYSAAIENFNTALSLDVSFKDAYFALASVHQQLGDSAQAETVLDRLEQQSNLTIFDHQLIKLYRQALAYSRGDYEEALRLGRELASESRYWIIPGFSVYKVGIYFYLAASYQQSGDAANTCRYWRAYRTEMLSGERIARGIGDHKRYQQAIDLMREVACPA